MLAALDSQTYLYFQAWSVLAGVLLYYAILLFLFRARKPSSTDIVRYDPPGKISPAVAATLEHNGRCELAFVAALVSLCVKRALSIQQHGDSFRMNKLPSPGTALCPEESAILDTLFFRDETTYAFTRAECSRLSSAYRAFRDALEGIVEPDLISANLPAWWIGVAVSGMALVPVCASLLEAHTATSVLSWLFYGVWILLGGFCLVAAVRVWPLTLSKLYSYIPWDDRPSRRLAATDVIPFILTGAALCAFIFLSVLTSTHFALLLAAAVLLNLLFRSRLHLPTSEGRRVLSELANFREFLARTATDRLNRENEAGRTPDTLEDYTAYAVALGVEHTWGEELVAKIVALIEFDATYSLNADFSLAEPVTLHLNHRK